MDESRSFGRTETNSVTVELKLLESGFEPVKATKNSAGFDLKAFIDGEVTLQPGERELISAGFKMALPPGYEAQIRPRSGLAVDSGITLLNSPGTIDSDYRGEIKVILINHGGKPFKIQRGDRIAQMIITALPEVELELKKSLEESQRGTGGFGHTGVKDPRK